MVATARHHARGRLDHRAARGPREAVEHVAPLRRGWDDRRGVPEDPPLRRRGGRCHLSRVRGRGARRGAGRRAHRGLVYRAVGLLRRPLPRAVPHPRPRGSRAGHRAGALHDTDREGSLARPPARARDREPVLRRGCCAGRRDAAAEAGVRSVADRRSVGSRRRAGAGRADGDYRRARARASPGHPCEAALAREPAAERVSVAGSGLTYDAWLERVPQLLNDCAEEWALRLGPAYPQGAAGYVVRAELDDGTPVVLKLIYPHREAEHEAEALNMWDGDGAVRLLRHDPERWAVVIERCEPGTLLADADTETALDVLIGLLPRLWKDADGRVHP